MMSLLPLTRHCSGKFECFLVRPAFCLLKKSFMGGMGLSEALKLSSFNLNKDVFCLPAPFEVVILGGGGGLIVVGAPSGSRKEVSVN